MDFLENFLPYADYEENFETFSSMRHFDYSSDSVQECVDHAFGPFEFYEVTHNKDIIANNLEVLCKASHMDTVYEFQKHDVSEYA